MALSIAFDADPRRMTVEEFFAWDGGGHQGKLELVDGIVRAQSYAGGGHGTIQSKLAFLINDHFRRVGSKCRVGSEVGVIPRFDPKRNVRKPDLAVTCTPHSKGERAYPDPILIVELLSPSNADDTWARGNWESIRACATVPSVIEILVVDIERVEVQVFRRDDKGMWPEPGETAGAGGSVRLASIDALIAVDDIYAGIALA